MIFRFSKIILQYAHRNGFASAFNFILGLILSENPKFVELGENIW